MTKGTLGLSTPGAGAPEADAPAARDPTDPERVAREHLARGDRRGAIAALLSAYGDDVYSHCRRVVRDPTVADDVFQQVFLEAFRDLDRFEGRSSLRAWLIGVTYHRSLDALKAQRRQRSHLDDDEDAIDVASDPMPDPAEQFEQHQRARELERCLQGLAAETRMTVLMRYRLGMSYEEMSSTVGERPGTLQARVARALPALRRCLEAKGIKL